MNELKDKTDKMKAETWQRIYTYSLTMDEKGTVREVYGKIGGATSDTKTIIIASNNIKY